MLVHDAVTSFVQGVGMTHLIMIIGGEVLLVVRLLLVVGYNSRGYVRWVHEMRTELSRDQDHN